MKYFPEKLCFTWVKQSYKNRELTPKELIMEIIRRAECAEEKKYLDCSSFRGTYK